MSALKESLTSFLSSVTSTQVEQLQSRNRVVIHAGLFRDLKVNGNVELGERHKPTFCFGRAIEPRKQVSIMHNQRKGDNNWLEGSSHD